MILNCKIVIEIKVYEKVGRVKKIEGLQYSGSKFIIMLVSY
jgi:hypothetical protein